MMFQVRRNGNEVIKTSDSLLDLIACYKRIKKSGSYVELWLFESSYSKLLAYDN